MKWNDEEGYVAYKTSLQSLKSLLGVSEVDYTLRCELAPYITYILQYLVKKLVLLGEDVGMKQRLQEVFDTFDMGASKIVSGGAFDLAWELGITGGDVYVEGSEIPYDQDRFVFAWSNVLTALVVRLKLQYASLLYQNPSNDCPCQDCSPGQGTKDFEDWRSGVYPEDEEYSYYNWNESNSPGWRTSVSYPECTKCSRKE